MHLPVRAPRMAAPSCHMRVTEKCERRQGVFHYAVGASRCLHEGTVVEHISRQYWLRILSEDGRPETTQGYRRKTEEIHVALRRHLEKIYQHEVRVGAIDFRVASYTVTCAQLQPVSSVRLRPGERQRLPPESMGIG